VTTFAVDGFRCTYLPVGSFDFDPEAVLVAPAEELAAALAKHDLGPDKRPPSSERRLLRR
jgi:hypothetical protein